MASQETQASFDRMLKPKRGDWVTLANQGHFTVCKFGAGQVSRFKGWNVEFFGEPLGKALHRIEAVWAIAATEDEARAMAAQLRDVQDRCNAEIDAAKIRFWQRAIDIGCYAKRFSQFTEANEFRTWKAERNGQ
jgi:hypothetical protein